MLLKLETKSKGPFAISWPRYINLVNIDVIATLQNWNTWKGCNNLQAHIRGFLGQVQQSKLRLKIVVVAIKLSPVELLKMIRGCNHVMRYKVAVSQSPTKIFLGCLLTPF